MVSSKGKQNMTDLEVSARTGKALTYAYYMDLVTRYKQHTLLENEYFDLELVLAKFEYNSYYR